MIWKLFRPRPILRVTFPGSPLQGVGDLFDKSIKDEYIVLIDFDENITQIKVEIIK